MKKEKGIGLVALILIIVAILVIGSVIVFFIVKGNDTDKKKDERETGKSSSSLFEEETDEEIEEEQVSNEKTFWVSDYKKWGEQKETFNLALFDGKFTAPIDLKTANAFAKEIRYYPNGFGQQKANTITEVMNLETMINSDTSIWLGYGELNEYGNYNDTIQVVLENFNETDTPMKDCFNNNWWSIQSLSVQDALGLTVVDEDYNASWDERLLLDEVVSKLGGPKHIYTHLNWGDSITYVLHYEYADFAIEILVMEINNEDSYVCKIEGVTYAPIEYWEEYIEEQKLDSSNFEIMK